MQGLAPLAWGLAGPGLCMPRGLGLGWQWVCKRSHSPLFSRCNRVSSVQVLLPWAASTWRFRRACVRDATLSGAPQPHPWLGGDVCAREHSGSGGALARSELSCKMACSCVHERLLEKK